MRRKVYSCLWAIAFFLSTLTFPRPTQAFPFPIVAECNASSNTGVTDVSCTITTSPNHLLVALFMGNSGTCNATPSDTFSLAWIQNSFGCAGPATQFINVYEAKTGSSSGSTLVDVHAFTGSVQFLEVGTLELSQGPRRTMAEAVLQAVAAQQQSTAEISPPSLPMTFYRLSARAHPAVPLSAEERDTPESLQCNSPARFFCVSTEVAVAGAPGTYSASFVQDASGSWIVLGTAYKFTPVSTHKMKVKQY